MKIRARIKEKIFDWLCIDAIEHAIVAAYLVLDGKEIFRLADRKIYCHRFVNQMTFYRSLVQYLKFWFLAIREAPANRREQRECLVFLQECETKRQRQLNNAS